MSKPGVNPATIMMAVIILLLMLVLFQWFNPREIMVDDEKSIRRADSLAAVNRSLLTEKDRLEMERNALRAQISALDSTIATRDATITNLNNRRNETDRRIDGLDNDGLIDFFTGFNASSDTTGR